MTFMTPAELDTLYEASKLDTTILVGSDIRQLIGEIRHHREDEAGLRCLFELRRAADQLAIARWRDAHPDNELIIPDHADLVIWLLDQLAIARRLDRVDDALAKQLGTSIEKNSALRAHVERWLKAYPLDQFPEPDLANAAELLQAGGMTLDAISASNMRHVLRRVIELMDSA